MTGARLADFIAAQDPVYESVVRELSAGRKKTHWIWFIFPQLAVLGHSATSKRYGLDSKADAREYFEHPILGARLKECVGLMLASPGGDIEAIMGYPDDLKFRSSMTLFAGALPEEPVFGAALRKYFKGERDPLTLKLLEGA